MTCSCGYAALMRQVYDLPELGHPLAQGRRAQLHSQLASYWLLTADVFFRCLNSN
jgi:hypothetical protein